MYNYFMDINCNYCDCSLVPVVEFLTGDNRVIEVSEPLSNSPLDSSPFTLMLLRTGDTTIPSTIAYSTVNQSAISDRDFVPNSGTIVFEGGDTSAEIQLTILANHDLNKDTALIVKLFLPSNSTSGSCVIGSAGNVTVVILNHVLLGPYFPGIPQLHNIEDGVRVQTGGLYYDLPLACITVSP